MALARKKDQGDCNYLDTEGMHYLFLLKLVVLQSINAEHGGSTGKMMAGVDRLT